MQDATLPSQTMLLGCLPMVSSLGNTFITLDAQLSAKPQTFSLSSLRRKGLLLNDRQCTATGTAGTDSEVCRLLSQQP